MTDKKIELTEEEIEKLIERKSLDTLLLEIGSLNQSYRRVDRSERPTELQRLYQDISATLSPKDDEGKIDRDVFNYMMKNMRQGPTEAVRLATEGIQGRVEESQVLYEKYKPALIDEVTSSIESELKGVKSKDQAATVIAKYLVNLGENRKIDQVTANGLAAEEIARKAKVRTVYDVEGSIAEYQPKFDSLMARLGAEPFVEETKGKDGKVTGYGLNKDQFVKLMDSIPTGATIYTNYKGIKDAYEAAAKAEAEKAKK